MQYIYLSIFDIDILLNRCWIIPIKITQPDGSNAERCSVSAVCLDTHYDNKCIATLLTSGWVFCLHKIQRSCVAKIKTGNAVTIKAGTWESARVVLPQ